MRSICRFRAFSVWLRLIGFAARLRRTFRSCRQRVVIQGKGPLHRIEHPSIQPEPTRLFGILEDLDKDRPQPVQDNFERQRPATMGSRGILRLCSMCLEPVPLITIAQFADEAPVEM